MVAEGRDQATARAFFDELGAERTGLLTHVPADGASWIHPVVAELAPGAEICLDALARTPPSQPGKIPGQTWNRLPNWP